MPDTIDLGANAADRSPFILDAEDARPAIDHRCDAGRVYFERRVAYIDGLKALHEADWAAVMPRRSSLVRRLWRLIRGR